MKKLTSLKIGVVLLLVALSVAAGAQFAEFRVEIDRSNSFIAATFNWRGLYLCKASQDIEKPLGFRMSCESAGERLPLSGITWTAMGFTGGSWEQQRDGASMVGDYFIVPHGAFVFAAVLVVAIGYWRRGQRPAQLSQSVP